MGPRLDTEAQANHLATEPETDVFGDPGNYSHDLAAGGDHDVVRHLLPTWMLAWLRPPAVTVVKMDDLYLEAAQKKRTRDAADRC